jgi:outer membrane protein W
MTRSCRDLARWMVIVSVGFAVAFPQILAAQASGDGFLFKQPRVAFKFESGYVLQRAHSELFDFVVEQHTVGRRDFDSPYLGAELSVRVSEHWDLAFGLGYQSTSVASEFREFIGADDLPIEQVTSFQLIPATLSAKYFFRDRGRSIGRFAWIPATIDPFIGVGFGVVSYRFEQDGDFVDFQTLDVFEDHLLSTDDAFLARLAVGVNISLSELFLVSAETRYGWASGRLNSKVFSGFDKMDLAGLQLLAGISFRH